MKLRLVLVLGMAALAALLPWAWFNLGPVQDDERLELTVRSSVVDFQFKPEPLTPQVIETLATTNLFTGTFTGGTRVTVFSADWNGKDARQMSVIQHTPDECWVNSGWKVVSGVVPSQVELKLDGRTLPFECRVFQVGTSGHRELVLWTTLLSGHPLSESPRFAAISSDGGGRSYQDQQARTRRAGQFLTVLKKRLKSTGQKQFVRLSVPVDTSPDAALAAAAAFADQWIELLAKPARR